MINKKPLLLILGCVLSVSTISADVNFDAELIRNSIVIIGDNNSITKEITTDYSDVEIYSSFISKYDKYDFYPVYKKINKIAYPYFTALRDSSDYLYKYLIDGEVAAIDTINYNYFVNEVKKSPPAYELKILNNSNKSVSIKKISFNVKKSEKYRKPIVYFLTGEWDLGKILIRNDGLNQIDAIDFNYGFSYTSYDEIKNYKHNQSIKWDSEKITNELDFKDALVSEGIDVDFLRSTINDKSDVDFLFPHLIPDKTRIALGDVSNQLSDSVWSAMNKNKDANYDQFKIYVKGTYKIKSKINNKIILKNGVFKAAIPLSAVHYHAMGDFDTYFEKSAILFKDSGHDYSIDIQLSKYIKPFEAERYIFILDSHSSGEHEFYASLHLSNGDIIHSSMDKVFIYKHKGYKEKTLISNILYQLDGVSRDDSLNIRDEPNINSIILERIPFGGNNIILLNQRKLTKSSIWVKIKYENTEGWVNSKYIKPMTYE